jgi:hypothetical protein
MLCHGFYIINLKNVAKLLKKNKVEVGDVSKA